MNIILGQENVVGLSDRYIVLSLDTFMIQGNHKPIQSFCLVESLPVQDMMHLQHWQHLHEKLIENYHKKNWKFCHEALTHLKGRWNGELDSFYQDLSIRIEKLTRQDPGPDWSGVIVR